MGKMWAGRFKSALDKQADDFNSSFHFDKRMYKQDISGSVMHAKMLGDKKIITEEEKTEIIKGLSGILSDIKSGALPLESDAEDIHMFIEEELTKRIGDPGKRLHTARSRNDQVALDVRMYMANECEEIGGLILRLITAITDKAKENVNTIMPGYTHLQRAQPITFAHHILTYAFMLKRDFERIADAEKRMISQCPIGSCALAGTTYDTDRYFEAEHLGFTDISLNSIDGVSDRDFCLELLSAFSILMMHLSRFSEEIILWSSWEFKFIELDDSYTTGSSIMPQKKNPDMAELVRGKTGRVYGDLMGLLTTLKGLPLAYNKDMQEDKEAVFDALDTVHMCLTAFVPMIDTMKVLPDNMRRAAAGGFINATDCADYLVGLCIENGLTLETLPLTDYKAVCSLFDEDVFDTISLERCASLRRVYGGPAPENVREQVNRVQELLKAL